MQLTRAVYDPSLRCFDGVTEYDRQTDVFAVAIPGVCIGDTIKCHRRPAGCVIVIVCVTHITSAVWRMSHVTVDLLLLWVSQATSNHQIWPFNKGAVAILRTRWKTDCFFWISRGNYLNFRTVCNYVPRMAHILDSITGIQLLSINQSKSVINSCQTATGHIHMNCTNKSNDKMQ